MPCLLGESDWAKWLGEEPANNDELLALLTPCPDEWLEIFPVDKKVGNVRNKGPELALPLDPNQPPPEQDYGGGDFVSLDEESSTDDDEPL